MSLWIAALTSFARNDKLLCTFSLRHCEGVRRTTEAIQSTRVACLFGLPRSLRSAPPKSAVLDYWQLEVLPLVLFCIRKNSLVSFFFAFAKTHSYRTSTQDVLGAFQAHGALAKIRLLDFLLAQLCRSFGFASTRFKLRSPGFASLTRPEIRRNDEERGRGNP